MSLFFSNVHKVINKYALFHAIAVFMLIGISFSIPASSASAAEAFIPCFGMGKINVRLYTDYFCHPCRDMEPKIEPILVELVKKNNINVTFIDTPFTRFSILYARHFLYIMNEKKDFDLALLARSVLIDAAVEKISEETKLEEYLRNKGLKFKSFDVKPTFDALNGYLKEDKIQSTPTCIIDHNGRIERYSGGSDIIKALENMKQGTTIKTVIK